MQLIVVSLLSALGVSLLIQLTLCYFYARALRSGRTSAQARNAITESPPRIRVIMPLRGADPFLRDAVRSVVTNDYPNLTLQIVIDHEQDSAFPIVRDALADISPDRYRIDVLRERSPDRSLIVSSFMQGVDDAGDDCKLLSFCAADMIAPPNWYWLLADAMTDPKIGCTLGNRWYCPDEGWCGSLVRQAWNAGAAVLMWLCEIPWSGAAALRPQELRSSGLYEDWKTSLVEDVTIFNAMQRAGLKLKFVPALTVVNREEVDLGGAYRFLKRQMMWPRLYHPRWLLVVLHSLTSGAFFVVPAAVAIVAALQGDWETAGCLATSLSVYLACLLALWIYLENTITKVVADPAIMPKSRLSLGRLVKMAVAIPITQLLYPVAAIACCLARHVDWRGIRYHFLGRGRVRMERYSPFQPADQPLDGKTSI